MSNQKMQRRIDLLRNEYDARFKEVGDSFALYGKTITITKIAPSKQAGKIDVD